MANTSELNLRLPDADVPSQVVALGKSTFPGIEFYPARTGDSFIGMLDNLPIEIRVLPFSDKKQQVQASSDSLQWLTSKFEGGYLTPEIITSRHNREQGEMLRVYKYPPGTNYLNMLLDGSLAQNDLAIEQMTSFILMMDLRNKPTNPTSAMQFFRRPTTNAFGDAFHESAENWKVTAATKIAGIEDPKVRSDLGHYLDVFSEAAGQFDPSQNGIGGMHGDPNFSRYYLSNDDKLVVSRFDKHTTWYIKHYGLASTISYIAIQLANIPEVDSAELLRKFLSSYTEKLDFNERTRLQNAMPVINQRLLGDLYGTLTSSQTQEKFDVDISLVVEKLPASLQIVEDFLHSR